MVLAEHAPCKKVTTSQEATTAPNRQTATGQKNFAVPKYYKMGYISSKECCPAVHSGETYVIGNLYLLRKNYVFSVGANYFSSKRD